jgi:hypothetical protein
MSTESLEAGREAVKQGRCSGRHPGLLPHLPLPHILGQLGSTLSALHDLSSGPFPFIVRSLSRSSTTPTWRFLLVTRNILPEKLAVGMR